MVSKSRSEWSGVFPATLCPFQPNYDIDEQDLARYLQWVAGHAGVKGIVVNGHTGEITSLRNRERAQVTAVAVRALNGSTRVISGVCAEGSHDAIDQAAAAREAGAQGILLMPPHHWLRFSRTSTTAVGFFEDVAHAVDIPIIVHQYPAWTRAGYSLQEMLAIAELPTVVCIKMGTRDMARQRHDYERLQEAHPEVSILTCHDEFLLSSLLEGADGALVGFAGYAPTLICDLVDRALAGDLAGARALRKRVDILAQAIYQFGEPSADAHQRMKAAAWLTGKLAAPTVRPPLRPLPQEALQQMAARLEAAGETVKVSL